ncbi:dTDP-4-keto-6-deoxy-D-glucose epimerase [Roseomonas sp. JC162]|uniref:dTDP-4-dehydrorhamnose 3,5-epimerase n=1 Tax=Neoroseomonas marina TaxID=1232220 RepID=A0A848ED30_9PROT|nr:dTDP-4-dehydrorhamnose 3,5-epimerase family protein [Neoroseomonas marina]NMJ42474.1 dTDP-4-keto-6-deoxy-D-glucose epimerase [Neoroseomonas marina]
MRFTPAGIAGVFVIEPEPISDDRGFFARTFCTREFASHDLETQFVQHSLSYNRASGTLRGMHFQREPHGEVKVVTCRKGAIHDVLLDLRADSPTRGRWQAFDLTADNRRSLYVPKGVAHGFQTLEADTEVFYLISAFHEPQVSAGVRHDDPAFGIVWPRPVSVISEKDRAWPAFSA